MKEDERRWYFFWKTAETPLEHPGTLLKHARNTARTLMQHWWNTAGTPREHF